MKASQPSFTESDTVNGSYKGSLFKGLFKDRKTLLDGYPAVKKGMAFPEPSLKFGGSSYTFKTTDVVDKVSCKADDQEFQARYKKETGKWDISVKNKCCPGVVALVKYEERGSGMPHYVAGVDFVKNALAVNAKFKPATGVMKASCSYDAAQVLKGMKLGADLKCNVMDLNPALMKYNLGLNYSSGVGLTALAVNDKALITLNHSLKIDNRTSAIVEAVASAGGDTAPTCPLTVGVGYQLDKNHELRARVNQVGQVQVCVKKDFSPNLSLLFATCVDVNKMQSLTQLPAFGFKVVTKA